MSEVITNVRDIDDEGRESLKFLILRKLLKDHQDDENIVIEFILDIIALIVLRLKKSIVLSHSLDKLTTKVQKELHTPLHHKQE